MRRVICMLVLFGLLGVQALFAQKEVSGTIISEEDGLPLPGVSVIVKGTTIGTITDWDGAYKLSVPEETEFLQFSFVGMQTQDIAIGENTVIDLTMVTDAVGIDEVVVTALGIKRAEKNLGYSATQVNSEDIIKGGDKSAITSLQGKVAGANITSASGDPSASTRIILRGFTSFLKSNQPLYIVDGVPVNNSQSGNTNLDGGYDFGNAVNDINPNDIESISVLKGAGATALYGSRAANGVILITTKSGKESERPRVTISSGFSMRSPLRLPQMQNTYGQGWDGIHKLDENGSWGPKFDGVIRPYGRVVDNQQRLKHYSALEDNLKDFFETGMAFQNSVAVSGGTENTTYYLSYSNDKDDGIFPTDADSYNRHTFSLKGSTKGKRLTSSASLNYIKKKASFVYTGQDNSVYNDLMQMPRDMSIVDMKDYHYKFNNADNYFTPFSVGNPYFGLNENGNEHNADRIFGNLELSYNFFEGLDATWRLGTDVTSNQTLLWYAINHPGGENSDSQFSDGEVWVSALNQQQINSDFMINYNKKLHQDFTLDAMLGYNINQNGGTFVGAGVQSLDIPDFYNLANSPDPPVSSQSKSMKRIIGLLGQVDLNYKNYLNLSGNYRNDWSSTLPKDKNNYSYFGSSISFIFSELIPAQQSILSFGKVRISYGITGSDALAYMLDDVFISGTVDGPFVNLTSPFDGVNAFSVSDLIGNPDLSPEFTHEFETGIDLRLFTGRLNLDITYYDKITKNQIVVVPLAYSTGYDIQTMNFGEITNKGIEALVSGSPVKTQSFEWRVFVNFTKNINKVVELDSLLKEYVHTGLNTITLISEKGYPMGRFSITVPMRDDEGHIIVDDSGMPIGDPEKESYGCSQPDWFMGIGNEISYKRFSLSVLFDIRKGGLMYSRTADNNYFTGNATQTTFNDRQPFIIPNSVTLDGEENTTPITMDQMDEYWDNGGAELDKTFLIDKSFIKLREVAFSYDLPSKIFSNLPILGASVKVFGRNLLLWTPEENNFIDPECTTFGNDIEAEFGEFGANPSTRIYGINLTINL